MQRGFTLIELAIVVVIIGLIIGGVVVGGSMAESSRVQGVIKDVGNYRAAISQFKEKYKYFPGDMPNATSFWGTDPGGCPAAANSTVKTATCNGNGDGFITDTGGKLTAGGLANYREMHRFWQHLAASGMITGAFSGTEGVGGTALGGINMPKSSYEGALFSIAYGGRRAAVAGMFAGDYQHALVVGAAHMGERATAYDPAFTALTAHNIDAKIDDGKPGSGAVTTFTPSLLADCASSADEGTSVYQISDPDIACSLVFKLGY